MQNKNVRLKEIAYELKLSINTVSRALRDCSDVSKETKEKVIQKAIEFGYMPNIIAQSLKNDNKKCIAILINNFKNLFFISMYDKLANLFNKNGYDFTIIYSKEKKVTLDIIKQCISQRVDGIISFFDFDEESINFAKYNNIFPVLLGKCKKDLNISQVYTDDVSGGKLAANYLLNFHKMNNFLYLGIKDNQNSIERFEAFKSTIIKNKPNATVRYIEYNKKTFSDEYDIMQYFEDGELGLFGFNDELIYDLIEKLNIKIPNIRKVFPKFHIVGFDSLSTRIKGLVDVTSINFDYDLMCQESIKILHEAFYNANYEIKKIAIPTSLHQRIYF